MNITAEEKLMYDVMKAIYAIEAELNRRLDTSDSE